MCRKFCCLLLFAAVAGGVWNWTRVQAASERVRDAWRASQKSQAVEDWDLHFRRAMRDLEGQIARLERRAQDEEVSGEAARLKVERLGAQVQASEALVSRFAGEAKKSEGKEGFVFAGQTYDGELARIQQRRFETERATLVTARATLEAQARAQTETAARCRAQATELTLRLRKLEARGQEIALRRQLVESQQALRAAQERRHRAFSCGGDAAAGAEGLIRLLEESLDRAEAKTRISERQSPPRTLSLEEACCR